MLDSVDGEKYGKSEEASLCVDLEKAYDSEPREDMLYCMRE